MKIIVGLGNPGEEYKGTFHNVGFALVDAFCNKESIVPNFTENKKFKAEILEINLNNEKIILAKPLTFMNNSGEAVSKIVNFYKITPQELVVIHDDLDIEFGKIKISYSRSSAGHKGVLSIIKYLGSEDFCRIRIGIKKENLKMPAEKYVLKKPSFFEKLKLKKGVENAVLALKETMKNSTESAMTKFN